MRTHSHPHETRIAFSNRSCLRRDRSDALIEREGPVNSGHDFQMSRAQVTRATHAALWQRSQPTLHFRNGVFEHVLLQTAQTPSLSHRVPATQKKNHPATIRGGRKLNGQSKLLPCVFTGSVVSDTPQGTRDSIWCTEGKAQTAPRRKARRADEAECHCHLPSASGENRGACELQGVPVDELEENLYP